MITNKYALIVRDDQDNRLAVVSTHREPRTGTGHNGIDPRFLNFCRSVLSLNPTARSCEAVSLEPWRPGVDVETLPAVLWVEKTAEPADGLACRVPLKREITNKGSI